MQVQEGSSSYLNHNDVRVIGKYFWLEEQNIALIVEIDEQTALLPAQQLTLKIAITGILLYIILVVLVFIMAKQITAPLRALGETVSRISAGELDASAPVLSDDEVGTLARAFNAMTEQLRHTLAGLHTELRERKTAQDELLQFRKVMDESNDAMYMIELETSRFIDFNRRAFESLGYSSDELRRLGMIDIAEHVETLDEWHKRVNFVREKGELIFETDYRRKDGSRFPVEVSAQMLEYGGNMIMVASVRDIVERRRTEAALRESEERFRKVFQSSPVAICITTLQDGRLLDANYAYWDLTGFYPHHSIGRNAAELKLWGIPEERLEFINNLKQKKSIFDADDHFHHTDGSLKQVISFYELIQINHEDCILSMFYDMSTQKKTMQALQQSEARIRALLNAFPDMILELSVDGVIVNLAPPKGYESVMPPESLIGKHIRDIFSESIVAQTNFAIQRAYESEQMNVFEFEMEMGGTLRTMEARLVVTSSTSTVLMLVRDITQRKWIEAERESLIHELEIRNEESETLRESLESIVGTFEFAEIIQRILEQIQRVIPFDTASIWRVEGNQQFIISGVNLPPEIEIPGTVLNVNEENSAFPILNGSVPYVLSNHVQAELPDFQMEPHTYVQSWLGIPLKTRGNVIGLIALDGRQENQFTDHHAALAVSFANQVAIALENASLFSNLQTELESRKALIAELKNKNAEAEALRESAAIVAATLEKDEAIERILEQLERVIPFDSASVQLLTNNRLEIVSMRGFTMQDIDFDGSFELTEEEASYPVLCGDAPYVLIDEIQISHPQFAFTPHSRIHSWLAVPLIVKGKKFGIIALDGYRIGQFDERHAQLAVTYANQVAIALENARLFSDLQMELGMRKDLITELENKNSELERFTYTVSHDLKSPLFTIRGFLGYLEQDALSGNTERLHGDVQRIIEATDKMQRLLNELLELSRIGRLQNEYTSFPLTEVVHEAAELVHGRLTERGIQVEVEPDLPVIHGDRVRLVEVLQNLLENAAKFMGDQSDPRIEIGRSGEDTERGAPIFHVRDNGIGIAPEHFDRVFGLFNKLDPRSDGTGIGLALVKRIIEVHGGRIWLESELGRGSTFLFTLPPAAAS
jgi:PAS domain S-box-containing protein